MCESKTQGILFIVAAPSGAGKTTLMRALNQQSSSVMVSVSHTTRPARPSERDGDAYYFIDQAIFEDMVQQGAFLEYAMVHGHLYGTSRDWVMQQLQRGLDVMLEIDWQGAQMVRAAMPDVVSIFIVPPTYTHFQKRLEARAQDPEHTIIQRINSVRAELAHYQEFDFIIINDEVKQAVTDLQAVIRSSHLDRRRAGFRTALLDKLIADADNNG